MALARGPTTQPKPMEELSGFVMEECDLLEGDRVTQVARRKGRAKISALEGPVGVGSGADDACQAVLNRPLNGGRRGNRPA